MARKKSNKKTVVPSVPVSGSPVTVIRPSHDDSHQMSSGAVISFIPFTVRDTYYGLDKTKNKVQEALKVNTPIVVVNDIAQLTIQQSKAQSMDTAQVELYSGDVNYSAAIANGDHCMIWILDNQADFEQVSNDVLNKRQNLNKYNSGLKFVGRVNSIRQTLVTQGQQGIKNYRYTITMTGFSELQTQIYFNELLSPALKTNSQADASVQFFAQVSEQYRDLFKSIKNDGRLSTEKLISFFLDVFMGPGPKDASKTVDIASPQTPNAAFLVPIQVAKYLGLHLGEKAEGSLGVQYSDILHRVFGQQKYSTSMFPDATTQGRRNYFGCGALKGGTLIPPANFSNTTLWSILTQFMNPSLNELYTTLKYVPARDGIYPVITLRQIPFTTDNLKSKYREKATFFSNLPRWKLDLNYPIMNYNLGTSDAERFNFFQVYTNTISDNDQQRAMELQLSLGNTRIDLADIIRTGPRIHTTTSDTEASIQKDGRVQPSAINEWADLIADFFVNGHLKMNGSMTVAGIQAPISVGDNLEFDNKVFHIEGITHQYSSDPSRGMKSFTTTLMLSHGHYIATNGKLQYMADNAHKRDHMPDQLLPGYSDEERYINNKIISSHVTPQPANPQAKDSPKTLFDKLNKKKSQVIKDKYNNKMGKK